MEDARAFNPTDQSDRTYGVPLLSRGLHEGVSMTSSFAGDSALRVRFEPVRGVARRHTTAMDT